MFSALALNQPVETTLRPRPRLVPKSWPTPEIPQETERRNSARTPVFMRVQDLNRSQTLWSWDLGLGGMQCLSRNPVWPGTYVDLRFYFPKLDQKLTVGAQILTLEEKDNAYLSMGIRFCMLSDPAKLLIYRFMVERQRLWDQQIVPEKKNPSVIQTPYVMTAGPTTHRPFEHLLLEMYARARLNDVHKLGFVRRAVPSASL